MLEPRRDLFHWHPGTCDSLDIPKYKKKKNELNKQNIQYTPIIFVLSILFLKKKFLITMNSKYVFPNIAEYVIDF